MNDCSSLGISRPYLSPAWWPRGSQASYMAAQASKNKRSSKQVAFCDPASEAKKRHLCHTPLIEAVTSPQESRGGNRTPFLNGKRMKEFSAMFESHHSAISGTLTVELAFVG